MPSALARPLATALLLAILHGPGAAAAGDGPRAPCGVPPMPSFAEPGASPNVRAWSGDKFSRDWLPPECTGWTPSAFDVLVAVAGSFSFDGDVDALLARIGAISSLTGIRYWSTTDKAWRPLVTDAYALSSPDLDKRRPDFGAAQMTHGQTLYYVQCDNRSTSNNIYRSRVLEVAANRVVIASQNVSPVKMTFVTLYRPGELQSIYFIERQSPGVWSFYSLTKSRGTSSLFSSGHEASYINRAVAFFRHIAGIPTDRDPPVAR